MVSGNKKNRERSEKVEYYKEDGRGKDDVIFSKKNQRSEERMHVELEVSHDRSSHIFQWICNGYE